MRKVLKEKIYLSLLWWFTKATEIIFSIGLAVILTKLIFIVGDPSAISDRFSIETTRLAIGTFLSLLALVSLVNDPLRIMPEEED